MRWMRLLVLAFLLPMFLGTTAQEVRLPIGWGQQLNPVDPIILPPLDLEAIRLEDSINDRDKSKPWRYGVVRPVTLDMDSQGAWTDLPNGDRIWRAAIQSTDAINLSVNFERFFLPSGGTLQLYNQDQTDYSKVYTRAENRNTGKLGSWYIDGPIIWIEYYQPRYVAGRAMLTIESVIHGYRLGRVNDLVNNTNRGYEDSGDCNYDVNCPVGSGFDDTKDRVKKAVALLNMGNGYLCSAALINNTDNDKTPYLLTANHCLQDSDPALWSVRFNWMSPAPVCGNQEVSANIESNFTMSGATLRANDAIGDFALVELFNAIPSSWDVAFAGWDRTDRIPEFQVGIHHPNGDIMKICKDDDPAMHEQTNGTDVWLIKGVSAGNGNGWDLGTTESGSSGSPLFDQEGRIIGQLYAGQSFCNGIENNGDFDLYGRMASSWEGGGTPASRLMDWLDASATGQTTIDVLDNALSTIDFELAGSLDIYPNPATLYVYIMNTRYPQLEYQLFDVSGKLLKAGDVSSSENRIDLSSCQVGVYFLKLWDGESGDDITKKLIIDK